MYKLYINWFIICDGICLIFMSECGIIEMLRITRFNVSAPLAQLVEQLTLNQWVQGSNP